MHLAYSAIGTINTNRLQSAAQQNEHESEVLLRYHAYQAACHKLSREIAAIQKYIPGWMPEFR